MWRSGSRGGSVHVISEKITLQAIFIVFLAESDGKLGTSCQVLILLTRFRSRGVIPMVRLTVNRD